MAQRVYICDRCGVWQVDARGQLLAKPDFFCCDSRCNHTTFTHFASRAEARGVASLFLRQTAGEIKDIRLQPRYPLHVVGPKGEVVKIGAYVADASFTVIESGEVRVVDMKGDADTHMSAWKRKHAEAQYGIAIGIIRS